MPPVPNRFIAQIGIAFMFFGGKIRQADCVLAVHQAGAYGSDRDKAKEKVSETQQSTQFTVSEIIGFLNEFETPPWVYEQMFRSREFYEFDQEEKERLASRTDEIDPQSLYSINGFINAFFKRLQTLEKRKANEPKKPELSEEEELKLVVMEIQKLLNAAGCNAGLADGIWGRRTQAAAVLFARTAKLPTSKSDLVSEKFIQKLRTSPANFCPKRKQPARTIAAPPKWWHAKYNFSCSSLPNVEAIATIKRHNSNSKLLLSIAYSSGTVLRAEILNVSDGSAKIRFGGEFPKNLRLRRSSDGKISTFFYKLGRTTCTGSIY